jgi:hypothetical protein
MEIRGRKRLHMRPLHVRNYRSCPALYNQESKNVSFPVFRLTPFRRRAPRFTCLREAPEHRFFCAGPRRASTCRWRSSSGPRRARAPRPSRQPSRRANLVSQTCWARSPSPRSRGQSAVVRSARCRSPSLQPPARTGPPRRRGCASARRGSGTPSPTTPAQPSAARHPADASARS